MSCLVRPTIGLFPRLMLANELVLAGVDVVVRERLPGRTGLSKALDLRGLLDGAESRSFATVQDGHFAMIPVRYDGWETRFPYQVGIPQEQIEGFLEDRLAAQGTKVLRGHEVVGFEQNSDSVTVHMRTHDGEIRLSAGFFVGFDGGRSVVRKGLGVDFPGVDGEGFGVIADVLFGRPPDGVQKQWRSMRNIGEATGPTTFTGLIPLGEPGPYRFLYGDRASRSSDMRAEVSAAEVRQALHGKYGDAVTV